MFEWLNDNSKKFLMNGYLLEGQTPEGRVREIADTFSEYVKDKELGEAFYKYMASGYYSLASPIWANYGLKRGMPVSCFGSYIDDSMDNIMYSVAENGMLMKGGGGTSGYFGGLRPRGAPITDAGESSGSVHFMKMFDSLADVVSQGSVRRGFFTAYQDIEHPDANEFLDICTEGNAIQGLTTGIVVGQQWLSEMEAGDKDKKILWAKVLKMRSELGFPYIVFRDNANSGAPTVYKETGQQIQSSNMCSEIMLPQNKDETFVCVLSSMNLLHYDEWKDTRAVEVLVEFLDTVVTEMVEKAKKEDNIFYSRILKFAEKHRAIGVGVLGWHSYLQSKMIPFESQKAARLNLEIFKAIELRAYAQSKRMFFKYGTSEMLQPYEIRNATTMAVAPTKSSSFILGQVSQSIEPEFSNCYIKDLAKLKVTIKNPYLEALLKSKGKDTSVVWDLIKKHDGSVQMLDFLTDEEKAVFKTFAEIDPFVVVSQAGVRQKYIDQGQSLNLMIDPDMAVKDLNRLHLTASQMGIKSLYYQYSINASQAVTRKRLQTEGCEACGA